MYRFYISFLLLLGFAGGLLPAQQLPLSSYQLLHSDPLNPGQSRVHQLNGLFLAVQQRSRQGSGWRSSSQFLNFHGRPQGKNGSFLLGLNLVNDFEHTEQRLSVAPTVSAKLLANETTELQVGIMLGLISWGSNYTHRSISDQGDPVALSQTNLVEVNSGLGLGFRHHSEKTLIEVGIHGSQLSGNLIASPLSGFRLYPTVNAGASFLFLLDQGILLGPRLFYQSALLPEPEMGPGKVNLGLMGKIPDKQLWAGAAYNPEAGTIVAGAGFPILSMDPEASPFDFRQSLDANFGFRYPLRSGDGFGPTFEVGVVWNFGKQRASHTPGLPLAKTFWLNEPDMVEHKQEHLQHHNLPDLKCKSEVLRKSVYLIYTWPDQSLLYSGDKWRLDSDGLVRRIGYEWLGMDSLIRGIVGPVIHDALRPDTTQVRDPENLEALKHLKWIELSCKLRVDEEGGNFGSGQVYEGEWGFNNPGNDSLSMHVVLDDRDTVLTIAAHTYLSNFELAAVKLHTLRSRLEYELNLKWGDQYRIVKEEELHTIDLDSDNEDWKRPIVIRIPRITSNDPHLQAFQENTILLRFTRKFIPEDDRFQETPDDPENY